MSLDSTSSASTGDHEAAWIKIPVPKRQRDIREASRLSVLDHVETIVVLIMENRSFTCPLERTLVLEERTYTGWLFQSEDPVRSAGEKLNRMRIPNRRDAEC